MAGLPALRSTAIRVPGVASGPAASKAGVAPNVQAAGTPEPRAVEPIAGVVEARPRDQSAALLLTLAHDEVRKFEQGNGRRTYAANQPSGTGQAARVCLAYRLQGAEPEIYSDAPLIFRFHI